MPDQAPATIFEALLSLWRRAVEGKDRRELTEEERRRFDVEEPGLYKPAAWFREEFGIPPERLRSARRRGRLLWLKVGREYHCSVPAARKLWPEDVTHLPAEDSDGKNWYYAGPECPRIVTDAEGTPYAWAPAWSHAMTWPLFKGWQGHIERLMETLSRPEPPGFLGLDEHDNETRRYLDELQLHLPWFLDHMGERLAEEWSGVADEQSEGPKGRGDVTAAEDPEAPDQYVTLGQMAALISRSKHTVRKWTDLPAPDVKGGGGKPDEWIYSKVRPYLEKKSGRKLPIRLPEPFRAGAGRIA